MRKFVKPLIAVAGGIVVSWGLQGVGVEALTAKLAGLAIVVVVLVLFWRRSAAL
jgi:hypothetical protein